MKFKLFLDSKVVCVTDKYVLSYKLGSLYLYAVDGKLLQKKKIAGGFNRIGLLERLMRLGPRCAVPVDKDHFLISFNGRILNYSILNNSFVIEHNYDRGMKNPLSFCLHNNDVGEKEILYGEYIWNIDNGPVAIYKRKGRRWNKVYEFPSNTITHIHNIIYDKYRKKYIILTGDDDKGSGLWYADLDFMKVEPLLIGSQNYRSCIAFPVDDGVIYATDTPIENNHLYKVILRDKEKPKVDQICELPGPCIYGSQIGENYYLSTTVEPDSMLPTWKYRITRKLGKGVKDYYSHLFRISVNCEVSELGTFKKDALPIWLFQFGNILFPHNDTDRIYITTQSVKPKSGVTLRI